MNVTLWLVIALLVLGLGMLYLSIWALRVARRASLRLARLIAQTDGLAKQLEAISKQHATQDAQRAADLDKVIERLTVIKRLAGQVREKDVPLLRRVIESGGERAIEEQRKRAREIATHVSAEGRHTYQQQIAWQELSRMLTPERTMPALRGWAASPDVLCVLVESIRRRPPRLVVECGSGASSVWLGLALRRFGGGRLVSLEHDERYAALSRDMVATHELGDIVEIRHAPLVPWTEGNGAAAQSWYDLAAVRDLVDIDLLFVDGPPEQTGPTARYPAGPVLLPRCSAGAVVVLDDADRADEKAAVERWIAAHPGFRCATIPTEKGTAILTRI